MDTKTIQAQLHEKHDAFIRLVMDLNEADFCRKPNEKWSAGEQLAHIYLSVKPLRQALSLPKFLPKLLFGKANRPSKSYDELVNKYKDKLAQGGRASGGYVPKPVSFNERNKLQTRVIQEIKLLEKKINRFNETDLDRYILPHPLLGKLTLREMLYFTIYHVLHHTELTSKNLE